MRFTERVDVDGRYGLLYRRHAAKAARMVRDNRAEPADTRKDGSVNRIVLPRGPEPWIPFNGNEKAEPPDTFNGVPHAKSCTYKVGEGWKHSWVHPADEYLFTTVLRECIK
jgi:hypothetical protein